MKTTLQLSGLDCAHCAAELEQDVQKIQGVLSASVSFIHQKLTLEYQSEQVLFSVIELVNHFEQVKVVEENAPQSEKKQKAGEPSVERAQDITLKNDFIFIALSALLFFAAIALGYLPFGAVGEILSYIVYALAYVIVGAPVLLSCVKNVAKGKIFDENFLMSVASIGAMLIGEWIEGVAVMLLYQLGEALQRRAVAGSRRSIAELMALKSERAVKLVGREQVEVTPEEINVGDILLVKTGEKIAVDGKLLSSTAILDCKSLTGEAEYAEKKLGEELLAGCINTGAPFFMQAARVYEDSAVSKILRLVEESTSSKAAPEKFITKFAKYYTPIVCALAVVLAVIVPLALGLIVDKTLYFKDFSRWLTSALTFLVVSCPCALVISIPLTYFSGVGACAKRGVLVKGATYLETLAQTKVMAFDKTGTLTYGNFTVLETQVLLGVQNEGQTIDETYVLSLAAALEKSSAHPIAKAFAFVKDLPTVTDVVELAGRGLCGNHEGKAVLVGSATLMEENGVQVPEMQSVFTLIYVAENKRLLGVITVGDEVRKEAKTALEQLKRQGVSRLVMLTGDKAERAQTLAESVGIDEVFAGLLPEQKLAEAKRLKESGTLSYVGDGINDTPVMAEADCAFSMGKLGSSAAVETSNMVLVGDNLLALAQTVKIAKKTSKVVKQNIVFSIAMKVAFMALGAAGILPLWLAVFADVGVMLLAVANALRVKTTR